MTVFLYSRMTFVNWSTVKAGAQLLLLIIFKRVRFEAWRLLKSNVPDLGFLSSFRRSAHTDPGLSFIEGPSAHSGCSDELRSACRASQALSEPSVILIRGLEST